MNQVLEESGSALRFCRIIVNSRKSIFCMNSRVSNGVSLPKCGAAEKSYLFRHSINPVSFLHWSDCGAGGKSYPPFVPALLAACWQSSVSKKHPTVDWWKTFPASSTNPPHSHTRGSGSCCKNPCCVLAIT